MNSQHREARRQIDGSIGAFEICLPCKRAIFDDNISRIGARGWINDGFPGCEALTKPAIFCCFCRHVIRARQQAIFRGQPSSVTESEIDWIFMSMAQSIFVHEDGADIERTGGTEMPFWKVERDQYVRSIRDRFVSFEFLCDCLGTCEQNHGDTCNGSHLVPTHPKAPILLVDVQDGCLV
jgi:hypothetical protein